MSSDPVIHIAQELSQTLNKLHFVTPSHVYNPLTYAWSGHRAYLQRYAGAKGRVLLVGMNPGPWGMAQTGVPFGTVTAVRDWFHIDTQLQPPLPPQHEKYPIMGMDCHREEGSGGRVWGWAQDIYGSPEGFFEHFFIWNYCPLLFIGDNRNLIPEKLKADERKPLHAACNQALQEVVAYLQPQAVVGIGRYAQKRLQEVIGEQQTVHYLLHPSPANPRANKHWPEIARETLGPWM